MGVVVRPSHNLGLDRQRIEFGSVIWFGFKAIEEIEIPQESPGGAWWNRRLRYWSTRWFFSHPRKSGGRPARLERRNVPHAADNPPEIKPAMKKWTTFAFAPRTYLHVTFSSVCQVLHDVLQFLLVSANICHQEEKSWRAYCLEISAEGMGCDLPMDLTVRNSSNFKFALDSNISAISLNIEKCSATMLYFSMSLGWNLLRYSSRATLRFCTCNREVDEIGLSDWKGSVPTTSDWHWGTSDGATTSQLASKYPNNGRYG